MDSLMFNDIMEKLNKIEGLLIVKVDKEEPVVNYMSISDYAVQSGLSKTTVYNMIVDGRLNHTRCGTTKILIDEKSTAYIEMYKARKSWIDVYRRGTK